VKSPAYRVLGEDVPSPEGHRHESRLRRLSDAGVSWDEFRELRDRVQNEYYKPRTPAQLADDEAAITGLETRHADLIAEASRKRRAARIKAFGVSITSADEDLIARRALDETRSLKAVRTWSETDKPLIVLTGKCGVGKTVAAACALMELGGDYVRALDLARLFLAQFGDEVEQREKLIAGEGVLVIDDIGTERNAEAMGVGLVEVLDARRRGQRNVWCTNLSKADFLARFPDERLHSRLAQSAVWLADTGTDQRRAK
jgi:DNA replication protein DnaC